MKTILVDAVHCFVIETPDGFRVFEDMHKLLETYSNKKIVLTGANAEEWKTFNLDSVSYEVFSLKHNPEKTDPKYYEILLEKFNLQKDEVIYFEHNPEAVKSAQSAGVKTYYYDNNRKDLESLRKFLNENL